MFLTQVLELSDLSDSFFIIMSVFHSMAVDLFKYIEYEILIGAYQRDHLLI